MSGYKNISSSYLKLLIESGRSVSRSPYLKLSSKYIFYNLDYYLETTKNNH